MEAEMLAEAKIHAETQAMLKSQAKRQKAAEDSDEDDLMGWHKWDWVIRNKSVRSI